MSEKPNIVVIMTDQQRWDSLGCYGCRAIKTPNLDRLAAEGRRYDRCYVSSPICTPSRASLMTGKPVPAHGVERLYDVLSSEQELFPVHLKAQGYDTALIGKLHVSAIRHELEHRRDNDGFDVYEWCPEPSLLMSDPGQAYGQWLKANHAEFYEKLLAEGRQLQDVPQECHMTHWAASRTVEYIESSDTETPFFCKMSVFDPHDPYHDYPQSFRDLVDADQIAEPIRDSVAMDALPEAVQREHRHGYMLAGPKKGPSWGKSAPPPVVVKEPSAEELAHHYRPERILKDRVDYLASIALLDAEVGRVLDALDRKGIVENTLVIFCSDHGDMLGDHALLAKGAYFYEPSVRVPLLLRWPAEISAGEVNTKPVQLHDLTATILAASGAGEAALQERMPDSHDLLSESQNGREYSVCVYHGTGICDTGKYFDPPIFGAMLCDAEYKLTIYFPEGKPAEAFEGQLFDLQQDPAEQRNLWDKPGYGGIQRAMMANLLDWYARNSQDVRPVEC